MKLEQKILEIGKGIGFDLIGISQLKPSQYADQVKDWVADEKHGEMGWYAKNIDRRISPDKNLFGKAKSAITVGLYYRPLEIPAELKNDMSRGLIARYAQYDDYHHILNKLLWELAKKIEQEIDQTWEYHCYVDTGPVLEREVGAQGGLGFIGKNTTLINPQLGSYFFLGEIISDLDLKPVVQKDEIGTCGTCTRCQVACPTQAFTKPWQLDARKCISYLTIENQEAIPMELRSAIGNRIYGCDICQEVCPWNKKEKPQMVKHLEFRSDLVAPKLLDLIIMNEFEFKEKFKNTPIPRTKWKGFMRNVLCALGNWGDPKALPALDIFIKSEDKILSEQAQWSYDKIKNRN